MGISTGKEERTTLAFWYNLLFVFDNLLNQNNKNLERADLNLPPFL